MATLYKDYKDGRFLENVCKITNKLRALFDHLDHVMNTEPSEPPYKEVNAITADKYNKYRNWVRQARRDAMNVINDLEDIYDTGRRMQGRPDSVLLPEKSCEIVEIYSVNRVLSRLATTQKLLKNVADSKSEASHELFNIVSEITAPSSISSTTKNARQRDSQNLRLGGQESIPFQTKLDSLFGSPKVVETWMSSISTK